MYNGIAIPATINEKQKTRDLYSGIDVTGIPGGVDYRKLEETFWPSRAEAMRETQSMLNQRDMESMISDAYINQYVITSRKAGYMPGDEEDMEEGSWRWLARAKKVWRGYTDFGNPLAMYKPILYGLGAKMLRSIEVPAEETSGLESVIRGILMGTRGAFEQYSHFLPYEIMPALRNHLSAAEGATNIKSVYVYYPGSGSKEYPIYITQRENDVPTEELLRSQIEYVERMGVSPYEDKKLEFRGRLPEFFDTEDGPRVLDLFTFFDYSEVYGQEPKKAHSWASKEGTWITQQSDLRNHELEDALPADLRGNVRVYDRPVHKEGLFYRLGELLGDETPRSGTMWYQWAIMKPALYACIDLPFEPLEKAMERIIPPEAMRYLLYQKWRVASEIWRGLYKPKTPYLYYGNLN
jgi:hypothetical protein